MNISSKLWAIRAYAPHSIAITQKASKITRYVTQSHLPSFEQLAAMTERQFDATCRRVFHES